MTSVDLLAYLRRPAFTRLWARVRAKLEERGGVGGTVSLDGASAEELAAVADLLGLRGRPREGRRIRLDRLDRALRESRFRVGLVDAMEALYGPLRNRRAEREAEEEGWLTLWREAWRHPAVAGRAGLEGWLADLESGGLLRRLAGIAEGDRLPVARRLLEEALDVLSVLEDREREELPTTGGVRRRVLAAERLGSSHALDDGSPVATLVLRALAAVRDLPPPASAAERRALWEGAGVVPDDLSSDVLVLGFEPEGDDLLSSHLRSFAAAGEPARVTLRQLTGRPLPMPAGAEVHVCENPALVAVAADELGASCRPLVCLAGMPNAAALTLLSALTTGGVTLRYHGDFDWGGIRIANALGRTVPWAPWRFMAADYRAAVAATGSTLPLEGRPVDAEWDGDLRGALEELGVAVEEEAVVRPLVEDLRLRRS